MNNRKWKRSNEKKRRKEWYRRMEGEREVGRGIKKKMIRKEEKVGEKGMKWIRSG